MAVDISYNNIFEDVGMSIVQVFEPPKLQHGLQGTFLFPQFPLWGDLWGIEIAGPNHVDLKGGERN